MQPQPRTTALVGIGLVAGCGLAEQVLLTRLLSAVMYYHFTFLAISLALLGTGAGAILVFVRPHYFGRLSTNKTLGIWSAIFGLLLLVSPLLLSSIHYSSTSNVTVGFAWQLSLVCLISFLPFLANGIVITLAIRAWSDRVNRVYAADLIGAGIGALLSVPLLSIVSAPTAMVALAALAALAALLFAWPDAVTGKAALVLLLVACGVTVASATTSLTQLTLPGFPGLVPAAVKWSPLNRVVGYAPSGRLSWGFLFYDKVYAPVPSYRRGQPYPNWFQLSTGSESVAFALTQPRRVLVIGGGGGRDIFDALSSGAGQVDVIELNRAIVDVVDGPLGRWSGAPYTLPRVHTTIGDGRSVLAGQSSKYDVINIGFTDTLSGSSANALALAENNLYTTQAFQEYFQHLAPGGILSVSRLFHLTGDEALRATVLMEQALEDAGVAHPEQHVAVVLGRDFFGGEPGTVIASLKPFTPAQLSEIRVLGAERGPGVASIPGGPDRLQWRHLSQVGPQQLCATYQYNVCAPTDNKPFFFNMKRLSQIAEPLPAVYSYSVDPYMVLGFSLLLLGLLCLIAFGLPLIMVQRTLRPPVRSLLFFGSIGLGYLAMEIVMIQFFTLFLGFPTYALTVVLFSLLVFTGVGAFLSNRWTRPRLAVIAGLGALVGLLGVGAFWLEPALRQMISLPFALRVVISLCLLAPLGLTAGTAMPIGLRRFSTLHPGAVAWAWGVNGIASVLGAVLAVFVAITWGYSVTALLAAACYFVAIADSAYGRWPARRAAQPDEGVASAERRSVEYV